MGDPGWRRVRVAAGSPQSRGQRRAAAGAPERWDVRPAESSGRAVGDLGGVVIP